MVDDKQALRKLLIQMLEDDIAHEDSRAAAMASLQRIWDLLHRLPPQMREHYLVTAARDEADKALRKL